MTKETKPRPFKKVCDASDNEWLQHRCNMVTGSEMALVLGRAPKWFSSTREELVASKQAGIPSTFEPTRNMLWGSMCEDANRRIFSRITGIRSKGTNALLQSSKHPRIGATLDGLCRVPETLSPEFFKYTGHQKQAEAFYEAVQHHVGLTLPLEMKQTGFVGDWNAGVPEYYQTQVQTQMLVLGVDYCVVAVRIGASDMRCHLVESDVFLHEEMVEAVEDFWKEVDGE